MQEFGVAVRKVRYSAGGGGLLLPSRLKAGVRSPLLHSIDAGPDLVRPESLTRHFSLCKLLPCEGGPEVEEPGVRHSNLSIGAHL